MAPRGSRCSSLAGAQVAAAETTATRRIENRCRAGDEPEGETFSGSAGVATFHDVPEEPDDQQPETPEGKPAPKKKPAASWPSVQRWTSGALGYDPSRVQRDALRTAAALLQKPVLQRMQQQQELMRRLADDLTRTPVLDMLERQHQQREVLLKFLGPRHVVIDAFNQDYATRLADDARKAARGFASEANTWEAIQEWLDSQRVIIGEAARAKEEGREFDLEAYGGPKLNHTALQTYLAILAIVLGLFQILTDDGITASEQRAITQAQTQELTQAMTAEFNKAIDRQTDALKAAIESVDRPELHITVEKGGNFIVKEGELPPIEQEPSEENPPNGRP